MKLKILIGLALLFVSGAASAAPIAAIAMMAPGIAAATVGGMAAAFSTFAMGASFIGGAVSLVGQISGDKNLTKIGSVIGLAGAGAGLIQGLAGGAAGGAASATQPGAQAIEAAAQTGANAAPLTETANLAADGAGASPPVWGSQQAAAGAAQTTAMPSAGIAEIPAAAARGGVGNMAGLSSPGVSNGIVDTLGKGGKWLEANPSLAKFGSGIIQGAVGAYGEQAAQDSQMDYFDRLRAQYSASITGMNSVPTFVNPNAAVTRGPVQNPVGRWAPGTPPPVVPPTRGA